MSWYVLNALATDVLLLVFAFFFLRSPSISPLRRALLLVPFLCLILSAYLTYTTRRPNLWFELSLELEGAPLAAVLLFESITSAIWTTEMVRWSIRSGETWTDRRHCIIAGTLCGGLFVAEWILLHLGKAQAHRLLHPSS